MDEFTGLLGGAPRLGLTSLAAIIVTGECPAIGVSVRRRGDVVVRLRRDIAAWLEARQRAASAGAATLASFVRFTVLHELAHVLNGDHLTFRFVRSVLLAHFVWIGGAVASAVSLVVHRGSPATPLMVSLAIAGVFAVQCVIARGFVAERERLADWRALQTLAPADAARLLERRGRRRATSHPTELEKLMIDLKVQAPAGRGPGWLSRVFSVVWPEGRTFTSERRWLRARGRELRRTRCGGRR